MKGFLLVLCILISCEAFWIYDLKRDLKEEKTAHEKTASDKAVSDSIASEARKEAERHANNTSLCLEREQEAIQENQDLQGIFRNATPVNEPKTDARLMNDETRKSLINRLNRPLP